MNDLARPALRSARRQFSRAIDDYLGVVTTAEDVVELAGIEDPQVAWSTGPMGWTACWRTLNRLPEQNHNGTFLDIGCGAGRMVCAAARAGYSSVVGIEIRDDLAALAQENADRLRLPHAPCEVIRADATTMGVDDNVTVVFLYNPFRGAVMDAVIECLVESVSRAPRNLTLAYANPVEHDRIASQYPLDPISRFHVSWRPTREWKRTKAVQFYQVNSRALLPPVANANDLGITPV